MTIALLNLFSVDVVYKTWGMIHLEGITLKVLQLSHACRNKPDEYCFRLQVGQL